ncbi:MAG: hypothetical protein WBC90_06870, partial [Albidovulum sp.]
GLPQMIDAWMLTGRGWKFPPCGPGEDHLVQGLVRHDALEALIFRLRRRQPIALIMVPATIFLTPSIIGSNCYADLPNRPGS